MRLKLTRALALLCPTVILLAGSAASNGRLNRPRPLNDPQQSTFSLTRLPEDPKLYNLVLAADDERTISGSFNVNQLAILKAIMTEAEKFALNGEAVGTKESIVTRFTDKHEGSFIVDVEKLELRSDLFLTLKTEIGRLTVEAGTVMRSTRREEGFFFDLLSRLDSILPPMPRQPSK